MSKIANKKKAAINKNKNTEVWKLQWILKSNLNQPKIQKK